MRARSRNAKDQAKVPQRKIIKIISKSIPVRNEPSRYGLVVCQLQKDFMVQVNSETIVDEISWLQINSGWICSKDANGSLCYSSRFPIIFL